VLLAVTSTVVSDVLVALSATELLSDASATDVLAVAVLLAVRDFLGVPVHSLMLTDDVCEPSCSDSEALPDTVLQLVNCGSK
jgi:hypothetical protein